MGKSQRQQKPQKSNKGHKTLRQKLRKKRQELKQHKKEKRQQKKRYDANQSKSQFFSKGQNKQDQTLQLRLKKISKAIQKFINIYEDDLQQFYQMFKTLDEGGSIDIRQIQNKQLYKCLKKLFKYLPMYKQNGEYKKRAQSKIVLHIFIKNKVTQSIQDYLQNGSLDGQSEDSSGNEQANKPQTSHKKKVSQKQSNKNQVKQEQDMQPVRLYKEAVTAQPVSIGPSIPAQMRDRLAQLFEQEVQQRKQQYQKKIKQQQDDFARIFNMGQTRAQIKATAKPQIDSAVPQHLLAQGSAQIGQKMQINAQQMQDYDKLHRPKKLMEIHKEMKNGVMTQEQIRKKKAFDRQRDILGKGTMKLMDNSTFFDFKGRMTKPKGTNQFL